MMTIYSKARCVYGWLGDNQTGISVISILHWLAQVDHSIEPLVNHSTDSLRLFSEAYPVIRSPT